MTSRIEKALGETKLGVDAKKLEDFSAWYTQTILRADLMDYYDISGCYILKPGSYSIWKYIQKFFGGEIEKLGIEDCYFPMFVTKGALEKEKDHVEGFAPEVAWVTKSGNSDLPEPIAVRPTSETIMYPAYAKWIQSHRDLPLRYNQWCNVIRWEFKHPTPFLRTREFLWQEGHTAFYTKEEADAEVLEILDLYRRVYEDLLAVPVIKGKKSEHEKFPGALYTTTVEAFIPESGRAIQGGTSHCLGQNFAKMFKIQVEGESMEKSFVWQNSWGLTTRTIGVMIMTHGDDKGLVLPPRVANVQIVIIPCGITAKSTPEQAKQILDACVKLESDLRDAGIRARKDLRENYTPGWKFNDWELKGIPLRVEIGPKDLAKSVVTVARRDTGAKTTLALDGICHSLSSLLDTVHKEMFDRAKKSLTEHVVLVKDWKDVLPTLDRKNIVWIPWCEAVDCEKAIKEKTTRKTTTNIEAVEGGDIFEAPSMGAKSLCIPFEQPKDEDIKKYKCLQCCAEAKSFTLFGRSY